jgi:hypothetical protein
VVRLDDLITRIEDERSRVAHAALTSPGETTFAYGKAVGFYAGLTKALTIITGMVEDEQSKEF